MQQERPELAFLCPWLYLNTTIRIKFRNRLLAFGIPVALLSRLVRALLRGPLRSRTLL